MIFDSNLGCLSIKTPYSPFYNVYAKLNFCCCFNMPQCARRGSNILMSHLSGRGKILISSIYEFIVSINL